MKRLAVLYNYSLLLERMTEKQFTQSSLAKAVGMGRTSFNLKINNKGEFSQAEIFKIAKILSIDKQDVGKYFFNVFVQKTGQKVWVDSPLPTLNFNTSKKFKPKKEGTEMKVPKKPNFKDEEQPSAEEISRRSDFVSLVISIVAIIFSLLSYFLK